MHFSRILYHVARHKATITLNRPEKRNALDDAMVQELTAAFVSAGKDPTVRVVVVEARGVTFCAGADLEYVRRIGQNDLEENRHDSQQLANLFRTMYELRKPTIAAVNGAALAGGCGLVSACDFIIASEEKAQFGYTEVRIGFIPAIVMIFLIKRIGEGRARELVLRGDLISAHQAKEMGLVSVVVPEQNLHASAEALAEELATQNSLTAMGLCKEMFSKLHGMNMVDSLDFAANMNAAARMTPDCKQGINAFLDKRKPEW